MKISKIFGVFLSLALFVGMLPINIAFAEETPKDTNTEIKNDLNDIQNVDTPKDDVVSPQVEDTPTTYTIKFDKNQEKVIGEMAPQIVEVNKYVELNELAFDWPSYSFSCWNTKPDGSGQDYKNLAFVKDLAPANGEITLYAQWDVPIYYSYLDNDGPGGAVMPPYGSVVGPPTIQYVRYGNPYYSVNIPNNSEKYIFQGWFTDQLFKHKYVEGSIITEPLHLEGKWTCSKRELSVDFKFVPEDSSMTLPEEVISQCPVSTVTNQCETVKVPQHLILKDVKTDNGTWKFVSWDKTEVANVSENVVFVGTWKFINSTSPTNEAPVITASDKTITVDDKFDPLSGVVAFDKEEGDITKKLEVTKNTVDVKKAGTYEVTFKVTDSNGLSATKTIKITVTEKEIVSPKPTPNKPVNPTPSKPNTPPDTGDNSNGSIFLIVGLVAVVALIVTVYFKNKNSISKK